MNEKNWLIRTARKKILGPISKKQVIDFLEKNSLMPEDEIVSGNGYWFSVKEKDLLDKYLYGDLKQPFNPISEAVSILSVRRREADQTSSSTSIPGMRNPAKSKPSTLAKTPSKEDLEYPDMTGESGSLEPIIPLETHRSDKKPSPVKVESIEKFSGDTDENLLPSNDDLEYPDLQESIVEESKSNPIIPINIKTKDKVVPISPNKKSQKKVVTENVEVPKEEKEKIKTKKSISRTRKEAIKSNKNDRYLYYIFVFLIILVLGAFFFYRKAMADEGKHLPFVSEVSKKKRIYFHQLNLK